VNGQETAQPHRTQPHLQPQSQQPQFQPLQPPIQELQPRREPVHAALGAGPLPVRGDHSDRPNPAAALPGVNHSEMPEHPSAETTHTTARTPSGSSVVRGTMGRPQLPKRRSQEHLVPQLRDAPAPRKDEEHTVHDPGLMAAFQRGIGLAESQPLAGSDAQSDPQRDDNTSKE